MIIKLPKFIIDEIVIINFLGTFVQGKIFGAKLKDEWIYGVEVYNIDRKMIIEFIEPEITKIFN